VLVHYADHLKVPLPEGHRFPMGKYALLKERLLARGLVRPDELVAAEPVAVAELERVHAREYVKAFVDGTIDEKAMRVIGFPWSPGLVARTLASAGGTLMAARAALRDGIAGNLAGGTHHAFADRGSGYCVFNDLAVAAKAMVAEGKTRRVLVVDVDVHQGDGTAAIFAGSEDVYTVSLHGERNFPFKKQQSWLDVELPDGTGDEAYLMALVPALGKAFEAARPDLMLVQAGVDALATDKLGRLSLSQQGVRARDEQILGLAKEKGVPVVLTLGGGYGEPIETSVEGHVGTYEVARRLFPR
jgi:acetoin utilization deacetylase AcuC-like enzyme